VTDPVFFGSRLRRARERRRLTLADLARQTKLSVSLFESLEEGTCERWPVGVYSRAHVRTYAELVGLDGDEIVEEFSALYPHLAWSEQDKVPEVVAALRPAQASGGVGRAGAPAPLRLVFDATPVPLWRVWLTRFAWLLHRAANGGAPVSTGVPRIQAPLGEPDEAPIVPLAGLQVDQ
jgi:transcriptional regulator with XRE-family HTH domain